MFLNLWGIFWVLVFFGGSIFVHELGHFIMAKKRGLYVPKFSIGFGPKLFSKTYGGTEYCISLLPLGGYVALPQMGEIPVLEGTTTTPTASLSFTDKFLVAVMGAVFNVLFAFVLASLLWVIGLRIPEQDRTTEIGYILPQYNGVPTPASVSGLKKGDRILAVDDIAVDNFSDVEKRIVLGTRRNAQGVPTVKITYKRGGEIHNVYLDLIMMETNPLTRDEIRFSGIIAPKQVLIIEAFDEQSAAKKCGLKKGDQLLQVDQRELYSFVDLRDYLHENKPQQVDLLVERAGQKLNFSCEVKTEPYLRAWLRYRIGEDYVDFYQNDEAINVLEKKGSVFAAMPSGGKLISCDGVYVKDLAALEQVLHSCTQRMVMLELETQQKSLIAVPRHESKIEMHEAESSQRLGIFFAQPTILVHDNPLRQFKQAVVSTLETLTSLANKNSDVKVQHLMGAPGIMRLLHHFSTNDFRRLLWFMVLLNINLAILNLLPIPVLDGGHILFALLEKLLGRHLPQRLVVAVQNVFVFLFLGLMAYIIFFDLRRWQGDIQSETCRHRVEKLLVPIQRN